MGRSVFKKYTFVKLVLAKGVLILFFLSAVRGYGQFQENRFAEEESYGNRYAWEAPEDSPETDYHYLDDDDGPPNPADPVPVDQYLPALILVAVGLVVWKGKRRA